ARMTPNTFAVVDEKPHLHNVSFDQHALRSAAHDPMALAPAFIRAENAIRVDAGWPDFVCFPDIIVKYNF
uniref:hypothetical protein n=1 Tax=Candidatus Entotheonella palauensis TaxID=93172 RepID=UPI001C4DDDE7